MKLKTVRLKKFKRFDDLTINLGENLKKIIALVGPNGCGKSSVDVDFLNSGFPIKYSGMTN
ncbi:MAG: AAA family ATPase [Nitrospirae bacterium]|nr:AAA family ATPase [Nitrospirota bacterium]MBI3605827.1 AAA family ATPase [Nitrospirota bacterium]